MRFILKMAWRDSRRNRARLLLFISAITVGIAALTAVRSFSGNLLADIDREAKTLLGADLMLDANQPAPDSILQHFDVAGAEIGAARSKAQAMTEIRMLRAPRGSWG